MKLSTPQSWVKGKRATYLGYILIAVVVGLIVFLLRHPQYTAAIHGKKIAEQFGCFACHGPGGTGGIANPGSPDGQIPAWTGGTAMMYINNENEIKEWILTGLPQRLRMNKTVKADSINATPEIISEGKQLIQPPLITMPAFEKLLSDKQLLQLIAYFKAVSAYESPSTDKAKNGYAVALKLGCFGCHGPGGRVGSINPNSFKGYIPPWEGKDFAELVHDREELKEWISEGKISRVESNPIAQFFTKEQVIQMKAYKNVLKEGELDALVSYIEWVNSKTAN